MSISIARVLDDKGHDVATAAPDAPCNEALATMAEANVGAVVVVDADRNVLGIVSERDVVRHLHRRGRDVLDAPVREVMTSPVHTCEPDATTDELMAVMTERRFRHVPVCVGGTLSGIVSIGDVVKWRLDELHTEAQRLSDYVAGSY